MPCIFNFLRRHQIWQTRKKVDCSYGWLSQKVRYTRHSIFISAEAIHMVCLGADKNL